MPWVCTEPFYIQDDSISSLSGRFQSKQITQPPWEFLLKIEVHQNNNGSNNSKVKRHNAKCGAKSQKVGVWH